MKKMTQSFDKFIDFKEKIYIYNINDLMNEQKDIFSQEFACFAWMKNRIKLL